VTNYGREFLMNEIDEIKVVRSYAQTGQIRFSGDPVRDGCNGHEIEKQHPFQYIHITWAVNLFISKDYATLWAQS